MRVCENRVLRRVFGPKRNGVAGGWSRFHNVNISRSFKVMASKKMGRARNVARMEDINEYKNLVGKPEGKILLGRCRPRWESSIPGGGWEFFSSTPRPDRLFGPPSLLFNGYCGFFHWG
jgi:hypothetical protein